VVQLQAGLASFKPVWPEDPAAAAELERGAAEMDDGASGEPRSNDGRRLDPLGAMEVAPPASDGVP